MRGERISLTLRKFVMLLGGCDMDVDSALALLMWFVLLLAGIGMGLKAFREWNAERIKEKRRKEHVGNLKPKAYVKRIYYGRSLLKFCQDCGEVHGNYWTIDRALEIFGERIYHRRCRYDARDWIIKCHNESVPVYRKEMKRKAEYERAKESLRWKQ